MTTLTHGRCMQTATRPKADPLVEGSIGNYSETLRFLDC